MKYILCICQIMVSLDLKVYQFPLFILHKGISKVIILEKFSTWTLSHFIKLITLSNLLKCGLLKANSSLYLLLFLTTSLSNFIEYFVVRHKTEAILLVLGLILEDAGVFVSDFIFH